MIRLKNISKSLSQKTKRDALNSILQVLKKVENKFPAKKHRYIEFEVWDGKSKNE